VETVQFLEEVEVADDGGLGNALLGLLEAVDEEAAALEHHDCVVTLPRALHGKIRVERGKTCVARVTMAAEGLAALLDQVQGRPTKKKYITGSTSKHSCNDLRRESLEASRGGMDSLQLVYDILAVWVVRTSELTFPSHNKYNPIV